MMFGITDCPKCKKLIVTVEGEEGEEEPWEYLCTCGIAFAFRKEGEGDDNEGPSER